MNNTQKIINEMHNGDRDLIVSNISADSPILVLNAMMAGTKMGLKAPDFLNGVKAAKKNDVSLLGIPLSKFAVASLHLLGEKKYTGSDSTIKSMIESKFAI